MEMMLLPILALLGLALFVDFGGDDDTSEPAPDDPNPELNRESFGAGDDTTTGTDVTDYLFLNDGDDMASGGAGDDSIFLGAGADQTVELGADGSFDTAGMEGDDLIRGGEGRDILVDALGSNTIYGDTGYDRINSIDDETSQDTADTVFGGFGNDVMFVDDGDTVTGGAGDDSVMGGLGADTIIGGGGFDEFYGGYGNDILNTAGPANDAADTVFGGAGDDTFFADGGDALVGGTGTDEFNLDLTDPAANAVAIDDFDPATEQLNVDVSIALDAVPTVTYAVASGGAGTNVLVDGSVAVFLVGVDPSALSASNVSVTNTNVTP